MKSVLIYDSEVLRKALIFSEAINLFFKLKSLVSIVNSTLMKEIIYSESARKQIKKIALSDKKLAFRILEKIEDYASGIKKKYDIKLLKGDFGNFKRLRIADYRVIFDESYNIITIYEINHRGSAYK